MPGLRTFARLTDDVLTYWNRTLTADDVSGMAQTDTWLAVAEPGAFGCDTFRLNCEEPDGLALSALIARAERGRDAAPAAAAPGAADAQAAEAPIAEQDVENAEVADEEPELDDEPEVIDDRLPMALVYYRSAGKGRPTTWPDPKQSAQQRKSAAAAFDIVFWFPFEVDKQGKISLPRDKKDRWPRFVRQWLDPQPVFDSNKSPEPIGHFDTYQEELAGFFEAAVADLAFKDYLNACLDVFQALKDGAAPAGFTWPDGCWAAVPRVLGHAVRGLSDVYRALPEKRSPSALEQLLGNLRMSGALDATAASCADSLRGHVAMVDKGAGNDGPDKARTADPLNDSQRRALHALIALGADPGVIAVSGPPGTGKTAMLRAMIANQWVAAACEGRADCPVTVVCGATNQSVENVMGTFDGAVASKDALAKRWLKSSGKTTLGFTASMPSKNKQADHKDRFAIMVARKKYPLALCGKGAACTYFKKPYLPAAALHWARAFETAMASDKAPRPYVSDAQRNRIRQKVRHLAVLAKSVGQDKREFARYDQLPSETVTAEVLAQVSVMLAELASILREILRTLVDQQETARNLLLDKPEAAREQLAAGGGLGSKWLEQLLDELQKAADPAARGRAVEKLVDVELRPLAFHLAARYWEARWMIAHAQQPGDRKDQLRRLAMLFPCMVSTLHSAPKLLRESRDPLFGFADLLIVDEAGQAAPELGAAVMSLARQAVVVGDLKQLAPVAATTEALDARAIADSWGGEEVLQRWRGRGADAATGSVMKLAATGASRSERAPDGTMRDGLLLREHYRCAESIIKVCIDLLYHEHDYDTDCTLRACELIPMIKDPLPGSLDDADLPLLDEDDEQALRARMKAAYPLPPLAFYQTGGPNDEPRKEESWLNPGEVDAIVSWIETSGRQLCRWIARADGRVNGSEDLARVVAVVTPFRGQAKAIREAIRQRIDPTEPMYENKPLSERMTIGTVHTLQGAEKPVVLFSAVNKESPADRRTPDNRRQRVFIDRDDGRLLNVAISRAQKSFILFGHSDLFFSPQAMRTENDLPSAIVGRCLAGVGEPEREERTRAARRPAVKLGPTRLMVVESPHKAAIIQDLLRGASIQVFGSGGHIRNLGGAGRVLRKEGLQPHWHLNGGGADGKVAGLLQRTASRLLQCEELILGTDDDAQGEAIAWHILDVLHTAPWFAHVKRVRRIRFQALTPQALEQAFAEGMVVELDGASPSARMQSACAALNMGVAYGALAMGVLDNLIGSVYARHGLYGGGRVKGPLLRALAGEGDPENAPGGRYGLGIAVRLGADGPAVPARLMVSRAGGPWKPWGVSERRQAEYYAGALAEAHFWPVPSLIAEQEVGVPSEEQIGTNTILREAFRRLRMMPGETMRVLQTLYEGGERRDEEEEEDMHGHAWASMCDGVLSLTTQGAAAAARICADPWLRRISAGELLNEFDQALSVLACRHGATVDDYKLFVSTWAARFDNAKEDEPIKTPAGPTLDATGAPLDLFAGMPDVPLPSWRSRSAAPGPDGGDATARDGAGGTADDEAGIPGRRQGAHGALMPVNMRIGEDSEHFTDLPQRERELYNLMYRLTLAAVAVDVRVRLVRYIFALDMRAEKEEEKFGVEVTMLSEVLDKGWAGVDPDGWKGVAGQWAAPDLERWLEECETPPILEIVPCILTRSLSLPTVDRLLAWMQERGLGRPSTFSTHVSDLLARKRGSGDPGAALPLEEQA